MAAPYRDSLDSHIGAMERRIDALEVALQGDRFGRWIFRVVALLGGLVVLFSATIGVRDCTNTKPSAPTAAERRRANERRVCEGIGMKRLSKTDDSLICGNPYSHEVVTFHKDERGRITVTRSKP